MTSADRISATIPGHCQGKHAHASPLTASEQRPRTPTAQAWPALTLLHAIGYD